MIIILSPNFVQKQHYFEETYFEDKEAHLLKYVNLPSFWSPFVGIIRAWMPPFIYFVFYSLNVSAGKHKAGHTQG